MQISPLIYIVYKRYRNVTYSYAHFFLKVLKSRDCKHETETMKNVLGHEVYEYIDIGQERHIDRDVLYHMVCELEL